MLKDHKTNIKIKLAALWTTLMFFYIYADYFELKTPGKIERTINLETPVGEVTPGLLVIFAIILIIPSAMIFLSVFLKPKINKWLNIIIASLWSVMSVLIIIGDISGIGGWYSFYLLYQFVELIVLVLIVWNAWNWPRAETNQ